MDNDQNVQPMDVDDPTANIAQLPMPQAAPGGANQRSFDFRELMGATTIFNDITDEGESFFGTWFERVLHRHHVHLSRRVAQSLRTMVIAFIVGFQITNDFRRDLNIVTSYLLPRKDCIYWMPVRHLTNENRHEMDVFLFQTNPHVPLQTDIPQNVLDQMLPMLTADGFEQLYHDFVDPEKGRMVLIEINRPQLERYEFSNHKGVSVETKNTLRSPLTVTAIPHYPIEATPTRMLGVRFFKIQLGENLAGHKLPIGIEPLRVTDFVAEPDQTGRRRLGVLTRMLWFMHENKDRLRLSICRDTIFRLMQGVCEVVADRYMLTTVSTTNFLYPSMIENLAIDERLDMGQFTFNTPATLLTFKPGKPTLPFEIESEAPVFNVVRMTTPRSREDMVDYEAETLPRPTTNLRSTFLEPSDTSIEKTHKIIFEVIREAFNVYGRNTLRHVMVGMALTDYHRDYEDLLFMNYRNEDIWRQLTTLILKSGKQAHVINVAETQPGQALNVVPEQLKVGRAQFRKWGIEKIQIHNIEMNSNEARQAQHLNNDEWVFIKKKHLDSISYTGQFPGLVMTLKKPIMVETLEEHVEAGVEIERVRWQFTQSWIDSMNIFETIDPIANTLFSSTAVDLIPVDSLHQASALFRKTLSNYMKVLTTMGMPLSVTGLLKRMPQRYYAYSLRHMDLHVPYYHQLIFGGMSDLERERDIFSTQSAMYNGYRLPAFVAVTRVHPKQHGSVRVEGCIANGRLASTRALIPRRPPSPDFGREPIRINNLDVGRLPFDRD